MLHYPSLDGFPVQTWGGVSSARVLRRSARETPPLGATLTSRAAFRERRKLDGSRFMHSTGEGSARASPFRTSTNMSSGVGKFHLLMANQIFERRLKTLETACVDDHVTIEEVVEMPKETKMKFDIEISEAPPRDKTVNQTLRDAESVLNSY